MKLRACITATLALAIGLPAPQSVAQDYPNRPIRMIVAFPAGSGIDASTRFFAGKMGPLIGQTVVVENRPGASGVVGTEAAAKAVPDGYTLYMTPVTPVVMLPYLMSKLPFDLDRDFVPISLVGVSQTAIMAHPSLPANTVQELVALSKKSPINVATVGVGSNHHLYGEWLARLTGAQFNYTAYNTAAPLNDLVAGHTQIMIDALSAAVGLVRGGKLKLLAMTGKARHPAFPDVPTFAEAGLAEYEPLAWGGLLAPAGTPQPIVAKLGAVAATVGKSPEMVERYRMSGGEAAGSTPAEFAAFIKSEQAKWSKVIKETGVRLD